MQIDNLMMAGLAAADTRAQRRENLAALGRNVLFGELLDALTTDPAAEVQTPGFKVKTMAAFEVINDDFAGKDGEASLVELLKIVGLCASGKPGFEVHLRASAWIAARCKAHADFHTADMAEEMGASL